MLLDIFSRLQVFADKEKILFSYGIRDHHNEDKVMAIQLFYRSEAQADSAR